MSHSWNFFTWVRLLWAGWYPKRNVIDQFDFSHLPQLFPVAEAVLSEFGLLKIEYGDECTTIDPTLCRVYLNASQYIEREIKRRLFPIGLYCHQDDIEILISDDGAVYILYEDVDAYVVELLSSSFSDAVPVLIGTHRSRKMAQNTLGPAKRDSMSWVIKSVD